MQVQLSVQIKLEYTITNTSTNKITNAVLEIERRMKLLATVPNIPFNSKLAPDPLQKAPKDQSWTSFDRFGVDLI